jgi:hypothetical protein
MCGSRATQVDSDAFHLYITTFAPFRHRPVQLFGFYDIKPILQLRNTCYNI